MDENKELYDAFADFNSNKAASVSCYNYIICLLDEELKTDESREILLQHDANMQRFVKALGKDVVNKIMNEVIDNLRK